MSVLTSMYSKSKVYTLLSFDAAYDYATSRSEVDFLASNRRFGPSIGISAKWSILNHLSRAPELRNSRLGEERSQLAYKNDSISALADLRNYYEVDRKSVV